MGQKAGQRKLRLPGFDPSERWRAVATVLRPVRLDGPAPAHDRKLRDTAGGLISSPAKC